MTHYRSQITPIVPLLPNPVHTPHAPDASRLAVNTLDKQNEGCEACVRVVIDRLVDLSVKNDRAARGLTCYHVYNLYKATKYPVNIAQQRHNRAQQRHNIAQQKHDFNHTPM
ncbi:hypothetical protein E2C01_076426 [Portunus trituberculatus]|uniref:Uncharacterized protein n=1 Tax=Portunus trituberculatus TaxID=210409 RepID=A0A5B7ID72_PORTR|nr:hypothetical protein [Portunus trituberculatus]